MLGLVIIVPVILGICWHVKTINYTTPLNDTLAPGCVLMCNSSPAINQTAALLFYSTYSCVLDRLVNHSNVLWIKPQQNHFGFNVSSWSHCEMVWAGLGKHEICDTFHTKPYLLQGKHCKMTFDKRETLYMGTQIYTLHKLWNSC